MKKKKVSLKKLTPIPAAAAVLALAASAAHAQTTPVFDYSFPASWNGVGDAVDLSSAGNNGSYNGGPSLTSTVPTGAAAGTKSVNTSSGGFDTTADGSLDNSQVAAAGGFTYNIDFMWNGTGAVQKLIDYAGTESLQLSGSTLEMEFASDTGTESTPVSTTISAGTWYSVTLDFDTTGNSLVGSDISGLASLYVNGSLVSSAEATKGDYGDSFDRNIGVGEWAANSRYGLNINDFQGDIYSASVDLGNDITPTPEPSSLSLALLGGFGMMGMMWNVRRRKTS